MGLIIVGIGVVLTVNSRKNRGLFHLRDLIALRREWAKVGRIPLQRKRSHGRPRREKGKVKERIIFHLAIGESSSLVGVGTWKGDGKRGEMRVAYAVILGDHQELGTGREKRLEGTMVRNRMGGKKTCLF